MELLLSLPVEVAKPDSPLSRIIQIIIPFKKGTLAKKDLQHLVVGPSTQQLCVAEFIGVAEWIDGSIQQLQMTCLITSEIGSLTALNLYRLSEPAPYQSPDVNKNSKTYDLSIDEFVPQLRVQDSMHLRPQLVDKSNRQNSFLSIETRIYNVEVGLFKPVEVRVELAQAAIGTGQLKVVIRNPNRAQHDNGRWDLGDKNSLMFRSFILSLSSVGTKQVKVRDVKNGNEFETSQSSVRIVQYSSGGTNWNSPNHVNFENVVPFDKNGFSINSSGIKDCASTISGMRCEPEIYDGRLFFQPLKFWQNFPAGLSCSEEQIQFEFFPEVGYLHELQPGEQKTFIVDFGPCLSNTVFVRYPLNYLAETGLLPSTFHSDQENPLRELIASGSYGPSNFLRKRESIDEYGWRNFGDLWADHETENYQGDEVFISHYNNQYDPLYGFLRQYLIDGNSQWFELADDLAKHIIDIDIYHTSQDRPEYNGGLFWHTDHFCKAATASHRTYSIHQEKGIYDGHAGGGGPGGQHCYTTGLLLYYFLTGNSQARDALNEISSWISNYYEGCDGVLEGLLSIKQSRAGLKDHLANTYPLDRGTANYVVALIDRYLVSNEQNVLDRAGEILKNTISMHDDISARKLDDVESCWFYVVLLQAAGRFLDLKQQLGQFDSSFYAIKHAYLKYADYMVAHEYPYLNKPEILEFPNHTWTAQDLRKAVVFAYACAFSVNDHIKYLDKSYEFYRYVLDTLSREPTTSYTRIQALLMLNSGFSYYLQPVCLKAAEAEKNDIPVVQEQEFQHSKVKFLLKRLLRTTFHNELNWCRHRFKLIDTIFLRFSR